MKAILLSIKPKYCELIANGKKTVEVRKTKPKIDVPFKCYIYCTKDKEILGWHSEYKDNIRDNEHEYKVFTLHGQDKNAFNGKVIGEFVCDYITGLKADNMIQAYYNNTKETCLTDEEIKQYANGAKLYYWHISNLVIYDKPKELSEFKRAGFMTEQQWLYNLYPNTHCHYEAWAKRFDIKRPPQSYMLVEKLGV